MSIKPPYRVSHGLADRLEHDAEVWERVRKDNGCEPETVAVVELGLLVGEDGFFSEDELKGCS